MGTGHDLDSSNGPIAALTTSLNTIIVDRQHTKETPKAPKYLDIVGDVANQAMCDERDPGPNIGTDANKKTSGSAWPKFTGCPCQGTSGTCQEPACFHQGGNNAGCIMYILPFLVLTAPPQAN